MAIVLSFEEALQAVNCRGQPHLLLGNGFSRACRNDIFAYDSLFDRADFEALTPEARQAFDVLGTTDFEVVMKSLRRASSLVGLYAGDASEEISRRMVADADGLREVLVSAIAGSHPDLPSEIPPEQYSACRHFLSHFKNIYTFNHDLLLYWALMQSELPPGLTHDDGFRTPEGGAHNYVTWSIENSNSQNVYYIHGELHVFDAGKDLKKYTWINTGVRLIDQIRSALEHNLYPLFVAEGESAQKMDRINHSGWLSRSYRSFSGLGGCIFIYGHSLDDNDEHIIKRLDKGKCSQIFVSLYGDPDSPDNQRIIRKMELMRDLRPARRPLEVHFYDAASARVWG